MQNSENNTNIDFSKGIPEIKLPIIQIKRINAKGSVNTLYEGNINYQDFVCALPELGISPIGQAILLHIFARINIGVANQLKHRNESVPVLDTESHQIEGFVDDKKAQIYTKIPSASINRACEYYYCTNKNTLKSVISDLYKRNWLIKDGDSLIFNYEQYFSDLNAFYKEWTGYILEDDETKKPTKTSKTPPKEKPLKKQEEKNDKTISLNLLNGKNFNNKSRSKSLWSKVQQKEEEPAENSAEEPTEEDIAPDASRPKKSAKITSINRPSKDSASKYETPELKKMTALLSQDPEELLQKSAEQKPQKTENLPCQSEIPPHQSKLAPAANSGKLTAAQVLADDDDDFAF